MATESKPTATEKAQTSSIDSSFPVFVPEDTALTIPEEEFQAIIRRLLNENVEMQVEEDVKQQKKTKTDDDDAKSLATSSWVGEKGLADLGLQSVKSVTSDEDAMEAEPSLNPKLSHSVEPTQSAENASETAVGTDTSENATRETPDQPFMKAILTPGEKRKRTPSPPPDMERKMLTENADVAFRSTKSPTVDLFFEVEKSVSGPRLTELLSAAWAEDPLITLKIIFLTRSIHLGKGERDTFYRCLGWLGKHHPLTLLANIKWLNRNLIEKKAAKKEDEEMKDKDGGFEDAVLVEKEVEEKAKEGDERFDVKNGVAHGYWKDLLNILVLSARELLNTDAGSPKKGLCEQANQKDMRRLTKEAARERRHELEAIRHANFTKMFDKNVLYRMLHLTVARLFADRLKIDLKILKKGKGLNHLSLAAKWAPSLEGFHDKHTFIASSIAEILYPTSYFDPSLDRSAHLKQARETYRRLTLSPLRKTLQVVERDIVAETFKEIDYSRIPSLAMQRYQTLFATKDTAGFDAYLDKVSAGTARISGAVLTPSVLVSQARGASFLREGEGGKAVNPTKAALLALAKQRVADGQWNTLVQRIRDSGTLDSTIAVADVSGSMSFPVFPDKTCPMDSAIGLALLVAEVTAPPFGGCVVTFSDRPSIVQIGGIKDKKTFTQKIQEMSKLPWGMSTNFVAVFEDLLLHRAVEAKVAPADMIKRVIVFSDMQFNSAEVSYGRGWSSSYDRIVTMYKNAGYEMPELVFWNLAGGHGGYDGAYGDPTAPKPVDADIPGAVLVGGYSQALLKVFMDGGSFEDAEAEEDVVEVKEDVGGEGESEDKDEEEDEAPKEKKEKQKPDSKAIMNKAVGHVAYSMLTVED